MFFLIFGSRSSKLKPKEVKGKTVCGNCNSVESFNVKGAASYFYLFWIPIIPLRKIIEFTCRKCGQHHFKETAPKSLISNYKNDTLKRPWWHFIFLALLIYKVITFAGFQIYYAIESQISQNKYDDKREHEEDIRKNNINLLISDLDRIAKSPVIEKDSVSYLLNREVDFSSYGLGNNEVHYFSKVKHNMILILMDIKNINTLDETEQLLILKNVRDVIYKSYPQKAFEIFVGIGNAHELIASSGNSNLFIHKDIENSEDYNYPFRNFYDRDSLPSYAVNTKLEHIRLVYDYENISGNRIELDTVKLVKVWKKINEKYKFKYGRKIEKLPNRIFIKSSETLLPEDLRQFFKYQNLTGPFIKIDKMKLRMSEISSKFYKYSINQIKTEKYSDKTVRIIPISFCPRWFPFYEDYSYTYAMDMLPDTNGHIGQIIRLGKDGAPNKFIATDLVSFLELYLKESVPTDIQDWN